MGGRGGDADAGRLAPRATSLPPLPLAALVPGAALLPRAVFACKKKRYLLKGDYVKSRGEIM